MSRGRPGPVPGSVLIGNPDGARAAAWQAALGRAGRPPAVVVPYLDLLAGRVALAPLRGPGTTLRVDSPGGEFAVERALIARGAGVEDGPGRASTRVDAEGAARLPEERGRIWFPRQWYLGFRDLLRQVDRDRQACPGHLMLNPPVDVETLFDKPRCHARLVVRGVACPVSIGPVGSYDELRDRMRAAGVGRVFIKLAHGSSASGVVALAASGPRLLAMTTVELVRAGGEDRLFNTRAVRRVEDGRAVAAIVDALAREGVHVERWVPKAGIGGRTFDLRVLVIAGRSRHVVARLSRGPLTNLHLKNDRADGAAVRARMAPDAWDAALATAERAASAFPGSLHVGVDLLIAAGFRRHAVLEANAFGDLLHGATHEGLTPHEAEVAALDGGWPG